ncbi:MAG: dihydropteroate synthase [Rhodothermales bacterium]|jgi:dihydropteroate synthase
MLEMRGRQVNCLPGSTHVMGVLNVTPDSFSDGGQYLDVGLALERARVMEAEGALFIDVGGASSRPAGTVYGAGAEPVSAETELERVLPVIRRIVRELPRVVVSVDTYRSEVAERVLDEGVHLINDITGLRHDPGLAKLAAHAGAALALMHSVGEVGGMPHAVSHENVAGEVATFLRTAAATAVEAGVTSILLDPGFGFGKSVADNFRLIDQIDRFIALGHPVMIGVSRKSSVGAAVSLTADAAPVDERLYGSLGATAVAVMRGASIVRTHDVKATAQMLRVMRKAAGLRVRGGA